MTGRCDGQYLRRGEPVPDLPSLAEAREHLRANLGAIPWEGLKLSPGDPAIPATIGGQDE